MDADVKDDAALDALLGATEEHPTEDGVVRRRRREETMPCEHVYLGQTRPPIDPVVREIERWRSGEV